MRSLKHIKAYLNFVLICYFTIVLILSAKLYLLKEFSGKMTPQNLRKDEFSSNSQSSYNFIRGLLPSLNDSAIKWMSAPMLPRALTKPQYNTYLQLLHNLSQLFISAGVVFIMCDGTLLGSYIFHDFIPWDDDMDLMVRYQDLPKIKKMFKDKLLWTQYGILGYHDEGNEYEYDTLNKLPDDIYDSSYFDYVPPDKGRTNKTKRYHKFKFFYKDSRAAGDSKWKWPYVDVKYFLENSTHVWNLDTQTRTRYISKNQFYPLHFRPFGRLWLPAPNDTRTFLQHQYNTFKCRNSRWNHKEEKRQRSRKVKCWRLAQYYPFVWRENLNDGVSEVLKLDGEIIQYIGIPESYNELSRPFAL